MSQPHMPPNDLHPKPQSAGKPDKESTTVTEHANTQSISSQQLDAISSEQMLEMLSHLQRVNLSSHLGIGLAHQLNHPLSASVNYTQCSIKKLQDDTFDRQELLGLLQLANQESFRAAELITRLRRFVSQAVPRISTLNFNHKVLEVVALLSPLLKEHDVELKLELQEELPPLLGDRIQIEQIMFNLGLNAIQSLVEHSVSDPCVVFKTQLNQAMTHLVCEVHDNGPGVDAQVMPDMFKPFQTTREHCLGLGLAMSKALCDLYQGQLTVENLPSGGCLATMLLPLSGSSENR
ncbi:MAG: sensor histidine kinase [Phycisphaeraceae bacterium JB051]